MKPKNWKSDEILPNRGKKIHELSTEEIDQYKVSERSLFSSPTWILFNPTPGARPHDSILNWSMTLFDGTMLTDAQHAVRLHWAKILVLTLLICPNKGTRVSPGTLPRLQRQLNFLLSWMSEVGYQYPYELTPAVMEHYIDQLPKYLTAHSQGEEIGLSSATEALSAPINLWNQRHALSKFEIESLPRHPFGGRGAQTVAKCLATRAKGWIKALPDEVAIPLLNKAAWFLGPPADDVLRLLEMVRDPLNGTEVNLAQPKKVVGRNASRKKRNLVFLNSFEFSTLGDASKPWHEKLDWAYEESANIHAARVSRVRELFVAVRDSAAIIVQAVSGMRLSELLGILSGMDNVTRLPKCVRLELSPTGLFLWFVIHSKISKHDEGLPREVDWVLGMRPVGSDEIPLAVRALQILNYLHEPWRACASTDRLILENYKGTTLPPISARLRAMRGTSANETMQRFLSQWVDLSLIPDESTHKSEDNDLIRWRDSKGKVFRTHMLRKTWAQFTLACDSRLLPAIQMQFHHLSLAITESGYIGNNPLLLTELNSISTQKTILTVFEIIVGKRRVAGRMGEQLEQTLEKLRIEGGTLPTSERWKQAVEWTERNDIKMFFTPHATCTPIRTSEMRCHDESNTPIWLRKAPNPATREPNTCAGCACAIMDKSHESFWSDRYIGCEVSIRQAASSGADLVHFREIRFRSEQSRKILKKFGADLNSLEARIISILENYHAKTKKGITTNRPV